MQVKIRTKVRIGIIAVFAMLVILSIQETNAFYTTNGIARNVVTSGDISAEIKETQNGKPYPTEQIKVYPGSIIDKEVAVVNTGDNPFWVRVKLINGISGEGLELDKVMSLDINNKDWTYSEEDGFFYYNDAVQAGGETEKLFTKVSFDKDMTQDYFGEEVTIRLDAYAVQTKNNGSNPFDADGWPAVID